MTNIARPLVGSLTLIVAVGFAITSSAQQTVFNVPTTDVLDKEFGYNLN